MAPKLTCPVCGDHKFHKERHTGKILCNQGHILEGYRNETHEATEYGPHTLQKRKVRSTKQRNDKKSLGNSFAYHGDRARYHYFQCLQVLLRIQIKTLTGLWNLPPEFEIVCRDMWALHLSLTASPPPPEPFLNAQDQDGSHLANSTEKEKEGEKQQTKEGQRSDEQGDEQGSLSGSAEADASSPPDDRREAAKIPGMEELILEASEAESSESDEDGQGQPSQGERISRKPRKAWRRDDSPAVTICALVHTFWLLRIPFLYKDLVNLIETYILPYLDPLRLLPVSLTRHLTIHTKQALSPHYAPSPYFLHTNTSRLSRLCSEQYGIFTPEINVAPILWRAIRHMAGTPTLYVVSKALANCLKLPLTLNPALAPPVLRETSKDPLSHKSDNVPPEVALAATVVIALKMIYGLDEEEVKVWSRDGWDPVHTMPALDAYMEHLRGMNASDIKASKGSSIAGVQEEDEQSLDAYLDFCEHALLDQTGPDSKAGDADLVAEYFPLRTSSEVDVRSGSVMNVTRSADGTSNDDDVRPVLPATCTASGALEADAKMVRPGETYTIYSGQDVFGKLPDNYAFVLSRAAQWTGVCEDEMSAVVERFERRADRRWKRGKRLEKSDGEAGEKEKKVE